MSKQQINHKQTNVMLEVVKIGGTFSHDIWLLFFPWFDI